MQRVLFSCVNGIWTRSKEEVAAYLLSAVIDMKIAVLNAKGEPGPNSRNRATATKLVRFAQELMPLEEHFKDDPQFMSSACESTKIYLCFRNGIYGFKVRH